MDMSLSKLLMNLSQLLGVPEGQGGLVCCSPWHRNELDTTEWLNLTEFHDSSSFYSSKNPFFSLFLFLPHLLLHFLPSFVLYSFPSFLPFCHDLCFLQITLKTSSIWGSVQDPDHVPHTYRVWLHLPHCLSYHLYYDLQMYIYNLDLPVKLQNSMSCQTLPFKCSTDISICTSTKLNFLSFPKHLFLLFYVWHHCN